VYASGSNGTHVQITLARADSDATSARTLGFTAESFAPNADGLVIIEGYLDGVDTSGAVADGDTIYLSGSTAGAWVTTKPVAPTHLVYLGVVAKKNPSTGKIQVKVQNGYELDELHDVLITSKTDGDLLTYESSTDLWKNKPNGAVLKSQLTSTGDLITVNTSNVVTRLGIGFAGTVLTSLGPAGLTWTATQDGPTKYQDPFKGALATAGGWALLNPGGFNTCSLSGLYQNLVLFPFYFDGGAIDRVAIEVTTLGTGVTRLGLFDHDDATGRPKTKLFDWGTVSNTATGVQELTVASTIPRGWAWVGLCWQTTSTTSPNLRGTSIAQPPGPLWTGTTSANAGANTRSGYLATGVTGAFADLTPSTLTLANLGVALPRVQMRGA
jgi:hypothetical protein